MALERRVADPYFRRNLIGLGIFLTVFQSLLIAYADYRFAESYRKAAKEITAQYAAADRVICFTGEWGFRYYLEREGARVLMRKQTDPEPGDIIVKPYVATPYPIPHDVEGHMELLEQRYVSLPYPVRILDYFSHAGFYSTGWGVLPFSLATGDEWEWFYVFRVTKKFEGPIPEVESLY